MIQAARAGTSAKEMAAARRKAEQWRRAFRALLAHHRISPAELARLARLPNANPYYNFINGHSDSLSQATLEKTAQALGISVAEIFGEQPREGRHAPVLQVRVTAASGAWRSSYEVPGLRGLSLPLPPNLAIDEAVQIVDGHASQVYRPSTIVGIQSLASLGARGLMDGDRVLLHRVRGQQHEVTVRQVDETGARGAIEARLIYASQDRRYAAQLAIPEWPYTGLIWESEGERVQIRGRVALAMMLDEP